MNRISQSPACSDEQESSTSSSAPEVVPPTPTKQQPLIKEEDKENVEIEQPEEVSFHFLFHETLKWIFFMIYRQDESSMLNQQILTTELGSVPCTKERKLLFLLFQKAE